MATVVGLGVAALPQDANARNIVSFSPHVAPGTVVISAGQRRLFYVVDIIRSFERLLAARRGEVQAEVTSARPLNDAETQELKSVLKAKLGREPRLEAKVDPTLLGGLVVKVGSRMIDSSLRTKLTGLRAAMRGN